MEASTFGLGTSIGSSDVLCAGDQCGSNDNSSSGATMLQVSTKHKIHNDVTQTPRFYTSLGFGQCSFEDGTYKSYGWSKGNCPGGPANCFKIQAISSLTQCQADCDSMPSDCVAINYYQGHCWQYIPGSVPVGSTGYYYTKTTEDYKFYECFSSAPTTTTTTTTTITTTTTTACIPYTQELCAQAATALGLQLGDSSTAFAGDYTLKSCYTYTSNSNYKGYAYYGTGGTESQNAEAASEPKIRVPGYDCKPCVPYSQEACLRAAMLQGLNIGGKGYNFASNHATAGCYTYSSGDYQGYAYYGYGSGTDLSKAVDAPKMRPQGYDCS
jgi:hypothetical protein